MPQRHEARIERDLAALRDRALRMAALCEAILSKSLRALWALDRDLAREVRSDDLDIDRLDVEIDQAVLEILALAAPVAGDLRQVVAIKAISTDLERIGDLARNIATSASRLAARDAVAAPSGLRSLAEHSQRALHDATQAFTRLDATGARAVLDNDDLIDELEDQLVREAIERLTAAPQTTEQELDLIFIARDLERVGDQATNIAEEVVLAAEAENLKHASKLAQS